MKMKSTLLLSIIVLLLALSAGPSYAAPGAIHSSYLALIDRGVDFSSSTAYTISSASTGSTSLTSTSFAPQPGDSKLKRDVVYLDLAKSRLLVSATLPATVQAVITGNLPDPCHLLRAVVGPISVNGTINIQVYSLVNPGTACITVLKPFSITIPLGTFTTGQYTVVVDGSRLGSFTAGPTTTSGVNK